MTNWFVTHKDLKQEDPLSPLLFILAADILPRMMKTAAANNIIRGIGDEDTVGKIMCLQYADDTLIFCKASREYVRNLKFPVYCIELITDLRINYEKTSMAAIGASEEEAAILARTVGCKQTIFPIRYLSLPVHYRKTKSIELAVFN